jgi:signal transduction histidine kinase
MSLIHPIEKKNNAVCLILFLWVCIAQSCNSTSNEKDTELSPQAKQVLAQVDTIRNSKNIKKSLIYLDSMCATFDKVTTKDLFEKYHEKFNKYLFMGLEAGEGDLYADSMVLILSGKENTYALEYVKALFAKGEVQMAKRNHDQAFDYYYDAHKFANQNLDRCDYFGFTYRIGLVRYKQELYLEAVPYIKLALAESNNCNRRNEYTDAYNEYNAKQSFLNTIGLCYERAGKPDSAIFYYQKTLKLIDSIAAIQPQRVRFWNMAKGVVYGNIGGVYAKLNNFKIAAHYLKQSIIINDRPQFDQADALTAKLKLADLYIRIGYFKSADTLLNQLKRVLLQQQTSIQTEASSQAKLYELQWKYADALNQQPQAYHYMQQYYRFRDSLSEIKQSLKRADIDMSFKANDQHHKIAVLDRENEVKQSYLIIFIVFLLIVASVLLLVWQNRKKLQALNVNISTQNTNLIRALKALEQSQEENTRMMKIVAHDLRSPIAAAISITGLLKMKELSLEDMEMVELLEVSSQHAMDMIGDLLSVNTTNKELNKETIRMHMMLHYCVNVFKFKATDKGQELLLHSQEAEIQADGEKIWRVFSNLIINAIKFSPQGAKIDVRMYKEKDVLMVKVQDQGIGIPLALKERIFDIFTESRRAGTAGEHSFGLGLAISKQIITAHGGKIWVESVVGEGSTFFVELPFN